MMRADEPLEADEPPGSKDDGMMVFSTKNSDGSVILLMPQRCHASGRLQYSETPRPAAEDVPLSASQDREPFHEDAQAHVLDFAARLANSKNTRHLKATPLDLVGIPAWIQRNLNRFVGCLFGVFA